MRPVMKKYFALAAAIIVICVAFACGEKGKTYFAQYENVRPIRLTIGDMQHVLEIARAVVQDGNYEKKTEQHRNIYHQSDRGVFVSAIRPKERALTAFGWGETIEDATKKAAFFLKRIGKNEDLASMRLRLDIIDKTSGRREKVMSRKWTHDLAHEGLMFDTDPLVALLPQEIMGFRIIESDGDYYARGMKDATKSRELGLVLRPDFQENSQRQYIRFTTQSCVEDDSGHIKLLYGVNDYDMPVTPGSVFDAVINAGDYLKDCVDLRSGRMNYRYYPHRDLDSVHYNELRHAGTLLAMANIYSITRDPGMLKAMEAGFGWLQKHFKGPNKEDKAAGADFLALKSFKGNEAKAGGAALTVAAMTRYTQVTGDRKFLPEMQKLARFIVFSTADDGRLEDKYYYDNKRHKAFDSDYYPGECAMALTMLYELDKNELWLDTAKKIAEYIRTQRDGNATVETITHDHWMSMAAEMMRSYDDDPKALLDHVFLIGDSMIAKQLTDGPEIDVIGAFARRPSSTPTACRTEALIALTHLADIDGQPEKANQYRDAALRSAQLLLRMQYNHDNTMFFPNPDKALGGFMGSYRRPEIQIDYVQHCVNALIGVWEEMLHRTGRSVESFLAHNASQKIETAAPAAPAQEN